MSARYIIGDTLRAILLGSVTACGWERLSTNAAIQRLDSSGDLIHTSRNSRLAHRTTPPSSPLLDVGLGHYVHTNLTGQPRSLVEVIRGAKSV